MEKLKGMLSEQNGANNTACQAESLSYDLKKAIKEAAEYQENLKVPCLNLLVLFNFRNLDQPIGSKYCLFTAVHRKTPSRTKKVAGREAFADWPGQRGRKQEEPGNEEVH